MSDSERQDSFSTVHAQFERTPWIQISRLKRMLMHGVLLGALGCDPHQSAYQSISIIHNSSLITILHDTCSVLQSSCSAIYYASKEGQRSKPTGYGR